ncbi:MAG TPA: cation diffusion facilitator family transporter [Acidimicrobiales bacterium]
MEGGSRKAIVAACIANGGISVAKFIGFAVTGSASMLAEGVHSVADTSNQGLLLLGGSRAKRAATPQHPFGYGRERYFWSFVVALVLFTLGSLFALFEGFEKVRHPHEIESMGWAVGILVFAIVLEFFSLRTAIHESEEGRKKAGSFWKFVRTSKTPELPVVLLEDIGAMVGLFFALFGVILAEVTGNPRWDAVGSIAIGLLLGVIAVILVIEMKSLLIGESASPAQEQAIRGVLEGDANVSRLIHMRTQHLGPDELLVGAKIELAGNADARTVAQIIDAIEARVREVVPQARVMYLEPDVTRV